MTKSAQQLKHSGFTIIELLIASALIVGLSTIVALSFENFRRGTPLISDAEQVTSTLRRAQLWALVGQTRGPSRPAGGWGVHFDDCSTGSCNYFIFADMGSGDRVYAAADDEIVLNFTTNYDISFSSLNPAAPLDVVFTHPQAATYVNGVPAAGNASVTLAQADNYKNITVIIASVAGQIGKIETGALESSCACTNWIDSACAIGGCASDEMFQTRSCEPVSCAAETQCSALPSCAPPPPGPEFSDSFNTNPGGLNGRLITPPDVGTSWARIIQIGNADLSVTSSQRLERGSCGSNEGALYQTSDIINTSDYEVSVYYQNQDSSDDYSILAARIQDSNNMYIFQWSTSLGELWVKDNGNWSQVPSSGADTPGITEGNTVTLSVQGSTISVIKTDSGGGQTNIISETDTTHTTGGHAGLGMGRIGIPGSSSADCDNQRLDDFIVNLL